MKRVFFTLPVLVFVSCLHNPQTVEQPGTDIEGFIAVWEAYEVYCPYFAHKDMDWKEIGESYFAMASDCETQDELREVIIEMMAEIEDPAIYLFKRDEYWEIIETIYPYTSEYEANYDMDVLVENYLEPNGWAGWEDGYYRGFGWCDPAVFPYVFFNTITDSLSTKTFDSLDVFIADCIELEVPAIILDVRMNPHGSYDIYGSCGHGLMGRFAAKAYPGAIYRSRSGPEYDQYCDVRPAVYPAGPAQYTGTVILLVGENCSDKSENITANFINFPNVVLVGDTTRGSVSRLASREISDDWFCKVTYQTILTYDKDWIEGAGIPPDIYVEATEADFAAGIDPVLDYAIGMLD